MDDSNTTRTNIEDMERLARDAQAKAIGTWPQLMSMTPDDILALIAELRALRAQLAAAEAERDAMMEKALRYDREVGELKAALAAAGEAVAERDRMREAVEKLNLPKTADGVVVTPGMTVYGIRGSRVRWYDIYGWSKTDPDGRCSCWFSNGYSAMWNWGEVYSTQAAAEQALARPDAGGEGKEGTS